MATSYDAFRHEFDRVMESCLAAELDSAGLQAATEHLGRLRDGLGAEADRASDDVAELEAIRSVALTVPVRSDPLLDEAGRVVAEANRDDGTDAERLTRARHGIEQLNALAGRATDSEVRFAIGRMAEPLAMLAGALQEPT